MSTTTTATPGVYGGSSTYTHVKRAGLVQVAPMNGNNGIRKQHGAYPNANAGATGWSLNNGAQSLPQSFHQSSGSHRFAYVHFGVSEGLCAMNVPPIEAGNRRLAEEAAPAASSGNSYNTCANGYQNPSWHYGCCI
jgi:hypothetical protein